MKIEKFKGTLCSQSDCKNNSVCRLQFENACGAWTTILLCEDCKNKLIEGLRQIGAVL